MPSETHLRVQCEADAALAVAASAYLSCSKIFNDYDGVQHDYTRKKGLVWQEVFLPEYAPQEWQDRGVLWNAVEENEKTKDSRLARALEKKEIASDRCGLNRQIKADNALLRELKAQMTPRSPLSKRMLQSQKQVFLSWNSRRKSIPPNLKQLSVNMQTSENREKLYAAVMELPGMQAKRISAVLISILV